MKQGPGLFVWLVAIMMTTLVSAQEKEISIILSLNDASVQKRPGFYKLEFECTITNASPDTLCIFHPNSVNISPHPWYYSINDKQRRFTEEASSSAPVLSDQLLIIPPSQQSVKQFFIHGYFKNADRFRVRYAFDKQTSVKPREYTRFVSAVVSGWSNEVVFSRK